MKPTIIENKYRKVLVAAQRARQIAKGARPLVQLTNMKATLIALQEVENGLIGFDFVLDQDEVEARLRNGA
jgi:DNA-directed RNA polymerase subunit omega